VSRRTHHGGRRHARSDRPAESTARPTLDGGIDAPAPVHGSAATSPVASEADELGGAESHAGAGEARRNQARNRPPEPVADTPSSVDPGETPGDWLLPADPNPVAGTFAEDRPTCTAPQLRRFIKSRAYVPMHELRRRFAIEGDDDDVTPVALGGGVTVFVGLPTREGRLLGELLQARDVGYELSLDPVTPIVIGLFPMRPVPRP
jgi:hypothetical protein